MCVLHTLTVACDLIVVHDLTVYIPPSSNQCKVRSIQISAMGLKEWLYSPHIHLHFCITLCPFQPPTLSVLTSHISCFHSPTSPSFLFFPHLLALPSPFTSHTLTFPSSSHKFSSWLSSPSLLWLLSTYFISLPCLTALISSHMPFPVIPPLDFHSILPPPSAFSSVFLYSLSTFLPSYSTFPPIITAYIPHHLILSILLSRFLSLTFSSLLSSFSFVPLLLFLPPPPHLSSHLLHQQSPLTPPAFSPSLPLPLLSLPCFRFPTHTTHFISIPLSYSFPPHPTPQSSLPPSLCSSPSTSSPMYLLLCVFSAYCPSFATHSHTLMNLKSHAYTGPLTFMLKSISTAGIVKWTEGWIMCRNIFTALDWMK